MKKKVSIRPWGRFDQYTQNEKSTVKIITVKPKKRLSLQSHKKRSEFWLILDNAAKVTVGSKTFRARAGSEIKIKKGVKHRIEAYSKPVRFLEISKGTFDEKDIERFQDDYGRA